MKLDTVKKIAFLESADRGWFSKKKTYTAGNDLNKNRIENCNWQRSIKHVGKQNREKSDD